MTVLCTVFLLQLRSDCFIIVNIFSFFCISYFLILVFTVSCYKHTVGFRIKFILFLSFILKIFLCKLCSYFFLFFLFLFLVLFLVVFFIVLGVFYFFCF